eukprot:SAG31_NODE_3888_length_3779_cov_1.505978_1_plen_143_part_00
MANDGSGVDADRLGEYKVGCVADSRGHCDLTDPFHFTVQVVRKGKVHSRLSTDSKKVGTLEKGEAIVVVEVREFQNVRVTIHLRSCAPSTDCIFSSTRLNVCQGIWRARFERGSGTVADGWVSFRNGVNARIIKKTAGATPF